MSAMQYPPAWHPDPNLPAGTLRWWDGTKWTEHVHHQTVAPAPTTVQPAQTAPAGAFGSPAAAAGAYSAPQPGVPQPASGQSAAELAMRAGVSQRFGATSMERNRTSFTAIGVVIAYVLLDLATGIVLFGVVPLVLSIRAFARQEKMAPVALGATIVAFLFAVSVVAHSHLH